MLPDVQLQPDGSQGPYYAIALMRITNSIIQQTSLSNVQKGLRELYRAQEQVSTGKKIRIASDDPVGASTSMTTRSSIRALEQYRRGIQAATARASAEEGVLDQITDVLSRAKELGVAFGSDTVNADQRRQAAIEVDELLKQVVSLGNTKFNDAYLFAGTGPNVAPYATIVTGGNIDFSTTSPAGTLQIEVSATHSVPGNHNGTEVFEDTGVLTSLRELSTALRSGDREAVIAAAASVDGAFDQIQSLIGEVGARVSSLQVTDANLNALDAGLQVLKSDVEDVEIEKAITELMGRQTSYQAALMSTSRIMGMTLADYLR